MNAKVKILDIIPECYVDTNLIEFLLNAKVNHQHCCSQVVGQLNNKFADKFAIGIIDKDKVELGYIKECNVIANTEHLTLLKHKDRCQFLITIAPAVDRFILDCATEQNVDTMQFGIPSTLKEFTKLSKSVSSNTDSRFKSLFVVIKDNAEIKALRRSLKYLNETRYKSDIDTLRSFFI